MMEIAAAGLGRLEGAAGVKLAVRQSGYFAFTAEVKVCVLGIADWPTAAALGQSGDVFALFLGDYQFFDGWRIRFGVALIKCA